MSKKVLYILIASICLSLAGIMVMQYYWIRNAFDVKEAQFTQSVNDALSSVVDNLEARENMHFISRNFEGDSIMSIVQAFSRDSATSLRHRLDSLLAVSELPEAPPPPPPPVPGPGGPFRHRYGSQYTYSYQAELTPDQARGDSIMIRMEAMMDRMIFPPQPIIHFDWSNDIARIDSMMVAYQSTITELRDEEFPGGTDREQREVIIRTPAGQAPVVFRYNTPGRSRQSSPAAHRQQERIRQKVEREEQVRKLDNRARKVQDIIQQIAIALETKPAPVQQRINKKSLQASLGKSFRDKGIELPFEFAVYSPASDSNPYPIRSSDFNPEYRDPNHKVSLFPNDLFGKPDLLTVYFPGQKRHVVKSLAWLLVGSALFTLIILLSSGGSIVVMIRQKKISDIKTDFINNMTHEFKTPIATISIAADSINNPRILAEPDRIKSFTRIIKEENNRMNTRVEQVLQMALLDSRDFKLRPVLADMDQIISRAVESFRLQIEKRNGTLLITRQASQSHVIADEDHLRNVLINLLDNANKYSLAAPEIEVFSFTRSGRYYFGVADKGMGMSDEAKRRVFDKFYRVTTGNIHNIKGFGLGLSYVKAIILAHRGDIRIDSEPGKGSRFEISLPLAHETVTDHDSENKNLTG